jgi:hypothetical protein
MTRHGHTSYRSLLLAALLAPLTARAADDDVSDEYRFTLAMHAKITDTVTGNGMLGFFTNPDLDTRTYRVQWPDLTYRPAPWIQLSGGLLTQYLADEHKADKLELRPFAGVKFFVPNKARWTIYNFTRYEYRNTENLDTHDWEDSHRVRSLFGVEVPLTSRERAWKPKTWYALGGAEPFFGFETHQIDQLRLSAGIGRVLTDRLRVEFTYYSNLTRPNDGGLRHTENLFQFNFRLALHEGLLGKLFSPFAGDERK